MRGIGDGFQTSNDPGNGMRVPDPDAGADFHFSDTGTPGMAAPLHRDISDGPFRADRAPVDPVETLDSIAEMPAARQNAFVIDADQTEGGRITAQMFGGNYFFANGNANVSDADFAWADAVSGVTTWRYPGGSICEKSFDMTDRRHFDRTPEEFIDAPSGDKVVPMSRFFKLAAENGAAITMVIPTREGLIGDPVKTGRNDDVSARAVSKGYLRDLEDFVTKAVELAEHFGVRIDAFEVGNEFWGSGQMNQVEYGKLAGLATVRIHNALEEAGYDADILVQTVHSRNEYNDNIHGHATQPGQIADGIKAAGAADMVDGIVNHVYARNFDIDEGAKDTAFDAYDKLEQALYEGPGGRSSTAGELSYALSEWNLQAAKAEDYGYGLKQAGVIMEMFHEAVVNGIDSAQIWKVMGSSLNSTALLHTPEVTSSTGPTLKHSGAAFEMLASSVQGLVASAGGDIKQLSGEYDVEYFTYVSDDKNVAFIVNQSPYKQEMTLDFGSLVEDFGKSYFLTATVLGDNAHANASAKELVASDVTYSYLTPRDMAWNDAIATIELQDWEILRIEATAITRSADILNGGLGNDFIIGKGGHDRLSGFDGNDVLIGGSGADHLSGGAGRDRAQYTNAKQGVVVDLAFAGNNTGQAAGDRFVGIEDLFGSKLDDVLIGDDGRNRLFGHNGDDRICGRDGNDVLYGMNGDDRFIFRRGDDKDKIKDFEAGEDQLLLKNLGARFTMDRIEEMSRQNGDTLVLRLGHGDIIKLEDVTFDEIAADIAIL